MDATSGADTAGSAGLDGSVGARLVLGRARSRRPDGCGGDGLWGGRGSYGHVLGRSGDGLGGALELSPGNIMGWDLGAPGPGDCPGVGRTGGGAVPFLCFQFS